MKRRQLLIAGPCAIGWSAMGQTKHSNAADPLRIGLTAVILADQAAFLSRWSDYLSVRVGHPVAFVARESYQAILDLLFSGQLDAAWICGYPYVLNRKRLALLAAPLYQGKPLYQAYLIANTDDAQAPRGWSDLKGRVLAYADPLSNSGWLVAQGQLRVLGLSTRDMRRTFFAHGHRNVAEAVATNLAHAGCIDGYVWETMRQQGMAASRQTTVIWRSDWYGFPPLVRPLEREHPLVASLVNALTEMTADGQGQALLHALNLTGFGVTSPKLYDPIVELARWVGGSRATGAV